LPDAAYASPGNAEMPHCFDQTHSGADFMDYPPHFAVLRYRGEDLDGSSISGLTFLSLEGAEVEVHPAVSTAGTDNLDDLRALSDFSAASRVRAGLVKTKPAASEVAGLAARVFVPKQLGLAASITQANDYYGKLKLDLSGTCDESDVKQMAEKVTLTLTGQTGPVKLVVRNLTSGKESELLFRPQTAGAAVTARVLNETGDGIVPDDPGKGGHLHPFLWYYRLTDESLACDKYHSLCNATGTFKERRNGPRCPQTLLTP
jgi:hypothetical protein